MKARLAFYAAMLVGFPTAAATPAEDLRAVMEVDNACHRD